MSEHHRVAIVGTGFAGLGMAIRLKQAGIDDFVLLERADDVGGTWRDNTYPGCAVRRPLAPLLVLVRAQPRAGRAPSPPGTRSCDYLRACAERFGIDAARPLRPEVVEAAWDDERRRWRLETVAGDARPPTSWSRHRAR